MISGTPYNGIREIKTPHGTYSPIFVDFTQKDGFKRLAEIKTAIDQGDTSVLIELIFLPLYGKINHKELAEAVLSYELELYKANKMPELLLAATLIMSNKILESTIGKIPENLANKINAIAQESQLLDLLKVVPRCKEFGEFEHALA